MPNSNLLDYQNLLDRAIAICKATVSGSEGFSFWYVSNEAFPFFVARIGEIDSEFVDEDELVTYTLKLYIRHITGNRTAGMTALGEGEALLYAGMPLMIDALLSCGLLESAAYPAVPDWIESVTLLPCPGLQSYDLSGIGAVGQQIGTTYVLECVCRVQIDLDYE